MKRKLLYLMAVSWASWANVDAGCSCVDGEGEAVCRYSVTAERIFSACSTTRHLNILAPFWGNVCQLPLRDIAG